MLLLVLIAFGFYSLSGMSELPSEDLIYRTVGRRTEEDPRRDPGQNARNEQLVDDRAFTSVQVPEQYSG